VHFFFVSVGEMVAAAPDTLVLIENATSIAAASSASYPIGGIVVPLPFSAVALASSASATSVLICSWSSATAAPVHAARSSFADSSAIAGTGPNTWVKASTDSNHADSFTVGASVSA
jgi:hypothetical protein